MRIIGMTKIIYIGENIRGHNCEFEYYDEEMERHILFAILSDGKKIKISLEESYGECGSGWCIASFGNIKVEEVEQFGSFDYLPYKEYELDDIEVKNYEKYDDIFITNFVFSVSSNGDDCYYPSGGYTINEKLFYKSKRANDNRPVWIFQGDSNLGKSFIAHKLDGMSVFETDCFEKLPELIKEDIIVIGNKYKFNLEDIKSRIFGEYKLVIVDFKLNDGLDDNNVK